MKKEAEQLEREEARRKAKEAKCLVDCEVLDCPPAAATKDAEMTNSSSSVISKNSKLSDRRIGDVSKNIIHKDIASLAASAMAADVSFDDTIDSRIDEARNTASTHFVKELQKVIEQSDVVLEVLDARDPNGCRCFQTETRILSSSKRLIFVLNKIDLVPSAIVQQWLTYLRRFAPAVGFKCLTVSGSAAGLRTKIVSSKKSAADVPSAIKESNTTVIGTQSLMHLLKNYARISGSTGKKKAAIVVGVMGCPNVGKSSIINSLKRNSSAVKVGGEAGVTRHVQEVKLDKNVKLIDSPGVLFSGEEGDVGNILRNAVKVSTIKDPVSAVACITTKCPPALLMRLFKIPGYNTVNEFIAHVSRARGRLSKGGRPDIDAAARTILNEWNTGKIQHYSIPPPLDDPDDTQVSIMSHLSRELNLDELLRENDNEMLSDTTEYHSDGVAGITSINDDVSHNGGMVFRLNDSVM